MPTRINKTHTNNFMHTQCPHCQTVFRMTAAHLNIAQGHVRCGSCQHIFNAALHLLKQSPNQENIQNQFQVEEELHLGHFQDEEIPELLTEDMHDPHNQTWGTVFFWGIMVILLATTLTGQAMWFLQPDKILQHPGIRPWLEQFCYTFLCTLPPTRDLNNFQVHDHIAQVHPEIKDVILFEATFTNSAFFPQPYPDLQLTFEDHNNQPLIQRRFKPTEYLLKPLKRNQQMQPQASIYVKLELVELENFVEDGMIVMGYRFEFF